MKRLDSTFFDLDVTLLPNLHFSLSCFPPPDVNVGGPCLQVVDPQLGLFAFTVENDGPGFSTPTMVVASGGASCTAPGTNCSVSALAPGGQTTIIAAVSGGPQGILTIDPGNLVAEWNEGDNEIFVDLIT